MGDEPTNTGGVASRTRSQAKEASEISDQDNKAFINEFIKEKLNEYTIYKFKDDHLWDAFKDDFSHFVEEDFKAASMNLQRALRLHLRSHGVWVRCNRKMTIAQSLIETLNETEPTIWTKEEIEKSNETFNSNKILHIMRSTTESSKEPKSYTFSNPSRTALPDPLPTLKPEPLPYLAKNASPEYACVLEPKERKLFNEPSTVIPTAQAVVASIEGTQSGSRELTALAKLYTSEDYKYGGASASYEDNLNYKFAIFGDFCKKSGVTSDMLPDAFSIMLRGRALQYYFTSCQGRRLTIIEMFNMVKSHFEGEEHCENMLSEWNNTSLRRMIQQQPNKTKVQVFKDMVQKLQQIQCSLDVPFQTEAALRNRIKTACSNIPSCSMAILIPTTTVSALINTITTALSNEEALSQTEKLESFFTDRKYHNNQVDRNRVKPNNVKDQSSNSRDIDSYPRTSERKKRCFICKKEGCWSTRHTKLERQNARKQFNTKIGNRLDSFIQEFEGEESINDIDDHETNALLLELAEEDEDLNPSDHFLTDSFTVPLNEARTLHLKLCDQVEYHKITHQDPTSSYVVAGQYTSDIFRGIMIDTGAATTSTAGYDQVQAYLATFKGEIDTSTAGTVRAHFGIGHTTSVGSIDVKSPLGKIRFHVVNADTPFLLCLQDMDKLGIYFNNTTDKILRDGKVIAEIVRVYNHPFLVSGPASINYLTEVELRQLHRRFGHPSVNRLVRTLERAGHNDPTHRSLLEHIHKFCEFCQKHGRSPGRFKFTLKKDVHFNYSLAVDVMFIDNQPILHVVDEATSFQAARWLRNMSALHSWEMLRICWIDVYTGPPDIIVHDAGTNFDSNEFRQNAASLAITTKCVPIEAHQSVGNVERYHGPLRRAYSIITEELATQPSTKEGRLQMAVKAVNDTAGPDGLVPTLLVFGTYPRISTCDPPTPSIIERSRAIKLAMAEVSKINARRNITDALRQRNGPRTSLIQDSKVGSEVLVWRKSSKKWEGPFQLQSIQGETCTIRTPRGPINLRSTCVKPYITERETGCFPPKQTTLASPCQSDVEDSTMQQTVNPPRRNPNRERQLPTRFRQPADITISVVSSVPLKPSFQSSRQRELDGLLEKGVFKIIDKKSIPIGARIFGSRFVEQIKHEGTNKAFEKSRLVVQAFKDFGKRCILTQAPTIQRSSQRLILAISLMKPSLEVYLRDISQAYTQSKTNLERDIFMRAPAEMGLSQDSILKVVLPLYGIPEAGTHWFQTYHNHHTERLKMKSSSFDPCLLYNNEATGIVGIQIDDSLISADDTFAAIEDSELRRANLSAKPREKLTEEHPLNFNGFLIKLINGNIKISQETQTNKIKLLDNSFTKEHYVTQRARGAYIATVSQPEAAYALSVAAQTTNPTLDDAIRLNKCLAWQQKSAGLTFVKLNLQTLRIVAFTDSSFANNVDYSSQIGYVIVLADDHNNANIVHWQSVKCRRVTISVLGSELYALSLGFDIASSIKSTLDGILSSPNKSRNIPLTICIDSKSLYECLVKLGTTNEKRLMIDIMCIRQSYERREITEILWIQGDQNPADAMTKNKPCDALHKLVETNRIELNADGWVERQLDRQA